MAVFAATDYYIAINSTDYTSKCKQIELPIEAAELDATVFSSTGWESKIGGLKRGALTVTFKQDFANGGLDDVMFAAVGTSLTFEVRPTSAAVGTSNPKYTGSVLISKWTPIGATVGDMAEVSVSWPSTGQVSRAEA